MHVDRVYHGLNTPQYVKALLFCTAIKVCTNLARTLDKPHDTIYREFEKAVKKPEVSLNDLKNIAENELNKDNVFLIIDDAQINKIYSRRIEGVELNFDGSTKRPMMGIRTVNAMLSDGQIHIPINSIPYFSKDLTPVDHKTKTDVATDIINDVFKSTQVKRILADAHYATLKMIKYLSDFSINFLMKVPRNRVVTIDGVKGVLQDVLRLKKNNRIKSARGSFGGIECYFYVAKIKDGTTIYLISNDQINHDEVVRLYRMRWKIELFHRTAKQYLGLGDCQMVSIEKQRQHMLYVMHAYAILSVRSKLMGLSCVEDLLKHLRSVKTDRKSYQKVATGGYFCYVA